MHKTTPNGSSPPETPSIETLMHLYYPAMYRLAVSILRDPDEAEDATQDSFIAAALALESYHGEASPKTWLYSITANTCYTLLRKRKARQRLSQVLQAFQNLFGRQPAPEEQAVQDDQNDQLWNAVNRLDEKHRLPVLLYYQFDLPVAEIAGMLGISSGTVHSRLYYARQQLLQHFKGAAEIQPEPQEVSR